MYGVTVSNSYSVTYVRSTVQNFYRTEGSGTVHNLNSHLDFVRHSKYQCTTLFRIHTMKSTLNHSDRTVNLK